MIQSGSDKTAIAWAIAKNIEQNNSFENQKKLYKDGLLDSKNPGDDIIEGFQGPIPPGGISLDLSQNGDGCDASGGFITNLQKGFWTKTTPDNDPTANTCHIYYYPLVREEPSGHSVGTLYFDEYSPSGKLLQEYHPSGAYNPGNWTFFRTTGNIYKAINLVLIPSQSFPELYSNTVNGYGDPYYVLNWLHNNWTREYITNAKYISTTPLISIDI